MQSCRKCCAPVHIELYVRSMNLFLRADVASERLSFIVISTAPDDLVFINLNHFLGYFTRRQTDDLFFLFVPENRPWYFMRIVFRKEIICIERHRLCSWKYKKTYFKMSSAEISLPACKALRL